MNGMIGLLKTLYYRNKSFFIIAILVISLVILVGCSTDGSPPPGPIGGGCG